MASDNPFSKSSEPIAIIGMSGQFPDASDLDAFWANLAAGVDSVTAVRREHWDKGVQGGWLEGVERFDPHFFGLSRQEAARMDPQQRLFLQHCWKALEDAGRMGPSLERTRTGVFVGVRSSDYAAHLQRHGQEESAELWLGNDAAVLSARLSRFLDLQGPSFAVDTACSSSLVAIELACQQLREGKVDLALAGGVCVMVTPRFHRMASQSGMLSPDGRCRAFDDGANGFVPAEGVGVLVLKPLARALAEGDFIHGVIRGIASNQEGRSVGPGVSGSRPQARLLREVCRQAGIEPSSLTCVEAHGTGSLERDAMEVQSLAEVFGESTGRKGFCALGSVKTNIGHAAAASGVAGVLKVLLAMRQRQLPPTLHFRTENRHLRLGDTPFFVNTRLLPWGAEEGQPRRAAVSAFGFGGTNCHLVLEEAPPPARLPESLPPPAWLFVLSAQTGEALTEAIGNLANSLRRAVQRGEAPPPADVAFTLARGRMHMPVRAAVVAAGLPELIDALEQMRAGGEAPQGVRSGDGGAAFRSRALFRELASTLIREALTAVSAGEARSKLLALGELYALGFDFDSAALFPERSLRRVPLPTYPFARERCWIPDEAPARAPEPLPEHAVLLEKTWRPITALAPSLPALTGTLVVLVNEETLAPARALLSALPGVRPFVIASMGAPLKGAVDARMDFECHEGGSRLGAEIDARGGPLAGILDLSDLRSGAGAPDERAGEEALGRIGLLQTLLRRCRAESFPLLHLTRGLRVFGEPGALDLRGAVMASLVGRLGAEYAGLRAHTVDVDFAPSDASALERVVRAELCASDPCGESLHRGGLRYLPELRPTQEGSGPLPALSGDKVYVITGGVRGLGLEVAHHLVARGARRLVLMGRQPLSPERRAALGRLEAQGVRLRLHTGPLTDAGALEALFSEVRASMGPIAGCVHCAGLALFEPPPFILKPASHFRTVFEPKIPGLLALEGALAGEPLDFFILFSSVSGTVPALSVGLADYGTANAFMDVLAEHRRAQGQKGWVSLAWPSWKDAGMGEVDSAPYRSLGFVAHSTADGLALLDAALATGRAVLLPARVEPERFEPQVLLHSHRPPPPRAEAAPPPVPTPVAAPPASRPVPVSPAAEAPAPARVAAAAGVAAPGALHSLVLERLRRVFSGKLRLPESKLGADTYFGDLGVDSILIIDLLMEIEKWLQLELEPAVPMNHPTLNQLSQYLIEAHPQAVRASLPEGAGAPPPEPAPVQSSPLPAPGLLLAREERSGPEPIAVIGMACHFPGSPDLESYWRTLRDGRDCITEVPPLRWRIEDFHSSTPQPGKSTSRWGGFIEGIEYFDPAYFQIAEADAPGVDPLMRQFLEASVQCLQHAGYTRRELAGRPVGVFVGSRMSTYSARLPAPTRNSIIGSGQNFISAHVSHFFDFKGPSVVVDTACSSSLVGLHMACQSLRSGEVELALAGGVDILLDEGVYLTLSESRALSKEGRCKTFDEAADGFVPGEGAGAVLLKPLSRALADGDRIYGLIEATAVNNDGHTMGITTPNPAAQQEVILSALRAGGIDPRTISYVEAHGTGTQIGDPIEVRALTEVYSAASARKGWCAVGSVKSNFGHLLSAAGISGLLKVMLSLGHRELPPTLHCRAPNPRFNFGQSPFFPNTTLRPWEPLEGVRRAGLSSFGFGGTNAHAILREAPEAQRAVRAPLAPVAFARQRYWLERLPPPPPARRPRQPLLALSIQAQP
jgi:acyl transferase domain-containing protein/NAD(P)-dependent dehydrogenase (short-subunit alcohol dehydrogenase family)/acyl carrier protein